MLAYVHCPDHYALSAPLWADIVRRLSGRDHCALLQTCRYLAQLLSDDAFLADLYPPYADTADDWVPPTVYLDDSDGQATVLFFGYAVDRAYVDPKPIPPLSDPSRVAAADQLARIIQHNRGEFVLKDCVIRVEATHLCLRRPDGSPGPTIPREPDDRTHLVADLCELFDLYYPPECTSDDGASGNEETEFADYEITTRSNPRDGHYDRVYFCEMLIEYYWDGFATELDRKRPTDFGCSERARHARQIASFIRDDAGKFVCRNVLTITPSRLIGNYRVNRTCRRMPGDRPRLVAALLELFEMLCPTRCEVRVYRRRCKYLSQLLSPQALALRLGFLDAASGLSGLPMDIWCLLANLLVAITPPANDTNPDPGPESSDSEFA